MSYDYRFSKALITGATSGIGKSLAYLLSQQGIELLLTGRNELALHELKNELSKKVLVQVLRADLAKRHDREKILSLIHIHAPDLVINNAGFGLYQTLDASSSDEVQDIVEVNCTSVVAITCSASKALLEHKKPGVIMNVSSMLAFYPSPGHATYAASKAFVNSFSEACDAELKDKNIRVLASCPGYVATQFRARASKGSLQSDKNFMTLSQEEAALCIWKQINSRKGVEAIDYRYKIVRLLLKCVPNKLIMYFIKRNMRNLGHTNEQS